MSRRTQEALYATLDLELSWSEVELPQSQRTKHVHALHPYLGKFVPQLVETFLHRWFQPEDTIYDPFCGSGTTLVEANAFGAHSVGCDVSAFNCLLARVKSGTHALGPIELALREGLEVLRVDGPAPIAGASGWARRWYSRRALGQLLAYRAAVETFRPSIRDIGRIVLSRAARSARLTTHFDLDFPKAPATGPYWCHKHRRVCRPVGEAEKFLRRYTNDTIQRLNEFALLQTASRVCVVHGDARTVELPELTGIITSPPYPGLIDYHEQHRYAYELLGLEDRRENEIGAAAAGTTRSSLAGYVKATADAFVNARRALRVGAPVIIVVNDSRELYPRILERAGLDLAERLTRHVNRRTGRRAGEFFEDVLVCRVA